VLNEYTKNPVSGNLERIGGGGGGGIRSVDAVEANISGNVELTRFITKQELEDFLNEITTPIPGVRYIVEEDGSFDGGSIDPASLISTDADNALIQGSDDNLFVPEVASDLTWEEI